MAHETTSNTGFDAPSLPDDVVVSARGVSKKFCNRLRQSMAYGMWDLSRSMVGLRPNTTRLRKGEFWAVDDLSFDLRRGEVLGLIGNNGSGKTTLLRMLAGIFPPDRGEIAVHGRVGALIAVGAGFHPHMTGRENVYLNGTILGMARAEIRAKYEQIVEFAEIGDFIDSPVATYSSGMRVRLGFSVAMHLDPDVLLIDEVLSVGDPAFRLKCRAALREFVDTGTSVIFVSHNLPQVMSICTQALWLETGRVVQRGPADEVCRAFEDQAVLGDDGGLGIVVGSPDETEALVTAITALGPNGEERDTFSADDPIRVRVRVECLQVPEALYLGITLRAGADVNYYTERHEITADVQACGFYDVDIVVPPGSLLDGVHSVTCALTRTPQWGSALQRIRGALSFRVRTTQSATMQKGFVRLEPAVTVVGPGNSREG